MYMDDNIKSINWSIFVAQDVLLSVQISVREWFGNLFIPNHDTRAGCSKLTTSLVYVSLKFQILITEILKCFLLKKC